MLSTNETLTLSIALIAAAISFWQLRVGVRQSKHQATFEHLGRVRDLLREASRISPSQARDDVMAFYRHQVEEFSDGALLYLRLLDALDLLGIAYKHNLVNRVIVRESLRDMLRDEHSISREYIRSLRHTLGSDDIYADLEYLTECCIRPPLRERLSFTTRRKHDRPKRTPDTTFTPTPTPPAVAGAGNDTRLSPSSSSSSAAENVVPLAGRAGPGAQVEPIDSTTPPMRSEAEAG